MKSIGRTIRRFLAREDGPTAAEYAVLLALMVLTCIVAIATLGNNASSTFSNVDMGEATQGTPLLR